MVTSQTNQWLTYKIMTNKILSITIITASLYLLLQSTSFAGVYKWVDENGQVHYGEQPGNPDAEQVTIRQNETTKVRTAKKDEDGSDKKAEQKMKEAAVPEMVEKEIPKKEKRRLCNEAKSDIAAINSRGRMREINAKGEYIYLSEAERQQRLAAAKKKQRKYCR